MTAETLPGLGTTLGAMLGGAGVSVVTIESLRRRPLRSSILVKRWLTWTVLAVAWLVGLSHPAAMLALLATVGTLSAWEYCRLVRVVGVDRALLMLSPISSLSALAAGMSLGTVLTCLALLSTVAPLVTQDVVHGPLRIGRISVGVLVAVVPTGSIWILQGMSLTLVLALLLGVALSDVTAFVAGSTLGRRKLAPILSPNKTWSGLIGNVMGAALGVIVAASISPIALGDVVAVTLTIAIGSVWGDLLESLLKRNAGVKDAGSMLPGFGGVLDRFDSLVVAAPLLLLVAVTGSLV